VNTSTETYHEAETAFFEGSSPCLIATFYENERPIQGLAGLMDWRFYGALSRFVKEGAITGKVGEQIYFPVKRFDRVCHLILVGAGCNESPGKRPPLNSQAKVLLKPLRKNLMSLRFSEVCVSQTDLGMISKQAILEIFQGIHLKITA
jgi:hypothetical protein